MANLSRIPFKSRVKNIRGQKFGRLTAIEYAGISSGRQALWKCLCECGKTIVAIGSSLRIGHTKSCGCYFKDSRKTCAKTHGGCMDGTHDPEYGCHQGMMNRCYNPKHNSYPKYGGAGVIVADEFHDYLKFKAYMGARPSENHSIDRFPDKSGNYVRGNMRWATRKEQQRNMKSNRFLEFQGERLTVAEWTERKGWKRSKLKCRLALGWTVERSLTEP